MYNLTNPAKQVYGTADMLLKVYDPAKSQEPVEKPKGLLSKGTRMGSMSAPKKEQPMDVALQYAKIFREQRESLDNE
mgnify:FL=1|tara:strand:- start:232 stop:462 length:231 start_codon:yes stop_codon:yes gene_type:complete